MSVMVVVVISVWQKSMVTIVDAQMEWNLEITKHVRVSMILS